MPEGPLTFYRTPDYRMVLRDILYVANDIRDTWDTVTNPVPARFIEEQPEVWNPNNREEGGISMPEVGTTEEVEFNIPLSESARSQVFRWLDVSNTLMQSLDIGVWSEQLESLTANLAPITYPVRRGGLELRQPSRALGGYSVISETIRESDATAMVDVASNGCIALVKQPNRYGYDVIYALVPRSGLENEAWKNFIGSAYIAGEVGTTDGESRIISSSLSEQMTNYREFRTLFRTRYMREVIHQRLGLRGGEPVEVLTAIQKRDLELRSLKRYEAFSMKMLRTLTPKQSPFSVLPMLPHKTLSSRRWGIEIEAVDIAGIGTPEHWDLKGDGSLRALPADGATEVEHNDWCAIYNNDDDDDDYDCDCDEGYGGESGYTKTGEWNSPVLNSYHSRGLKYLCDELTGRRSNKTPGVHVHVEANDLTIKQTVKLTSMYSLLEPLFDSAYQREDREYCRPVNADEFFKRVRRAKEAEKKNLDIRQVEFTSRYWSVNLASLYSHGTIEFRAMGPVYDYEHLVRWAYFCREMINVAKSKATQKDWVKVRSMEDLVVVFAKFGKETPTPSWAKNVPAKDVVEALGESNRRKPFVSNFTTKNAGGRDIRVKEVFEDYSGSVLLSEVRGHSDF